MLGASEAASVAAVREVVEQPPVSLQPLELLGQGNVRLQALPRAPEASSSAANANETLFRFAVVSDTHFWLPSTARAEWSRQSDALPERDGLLVSDSDAVVQQLLAALAQFARRGGSFAVHVGDSVCGGGSFHPPLEEYERGLLSLREQQRAAFGSWPFFHVPGNHDLDPVEGGLAQWRRTLGSSGNSSGNTELGYRAVRVAPGWRLLLLDSMDGVAHDKDGHGHIGEAQLAWLAVQLEQSAAASEQVILVMHQLLVAPVDGSAQEEDEGEQEDRSYQHYESYQGYGSEQGGVYVRSTRPRRPRVQEGGDAQEDEGGQEGGGEREEDEGALPGWLGWRGDFIDNRVEVLGLLARHSHVRLSFHGHVHANTLTTRHGVAFVTSAAASEYPMQWREVSVRPCELQIHARSIDAPALREKSRLRDTRGGRNEIKAGTPRANAVSIRTC